MKKIIVNILLYIIFCEIVFVSGWKVVENIDNCPIYIYQKSLKK